MTNTPEALLRDGEVAPAPANSDELLEALLKRYPALCTSIDLRLAPNHCVEIVAWLVGESAEKPFIEVSGPTLREALVALDKALAEEAVE